MTSAQGKLTSCGPGQAFSLQFTCTGPSCIDLKGIPTINCTDDGTTLTCTNGVTCPGPTNYTSNFALTQKDTTISQTQKIILPDLCQEIDLTSDGTARGTNASMVKTGNCGPGNANSSVSSVSSGAPSTVTSGPSSTATMAGISGTYASTQQPSTGGSSAGFTGATSIVSGYPTAGGSSVGSTQGNLFTGSGSTSPVTSSTRATVSVPSSNVAGSFRCRSKGSVVFALLLLFSFLVGGVLASAPNTHPFNGLVVVGRDISINVALPGDTRSDLAKRELSEELMSFLNLLSEYMASKITSGFANNLVAELFSAMCNHVSGLILRDTLGVDLAEACTTFVYASNLIAAPELEFLSFFGAGVACNLVISFLLPEVGALTNFACQLPNPCFKDLVMDPNNCGQCGKVCSAGVCANGVCTTSIPFTETHYFGVMSLRLGSPIMNDGVVARGERFYLSGGSSTYCPSPPVDCSVYDNVTAFSFSQGHLAMEASVPGGQLVYVMTTGELGFTQAHSAATPEGADTSSFTYDPNAISANRGRLSTTAFGANGFMACNDAQQQWQVFADVPSKDATNCLRFDAATNADQLLLEHEHITKE
ncbi:MAG: hypothetical protein M1839_006061 [Geoglossum umbratile]|nr:MAG: hypothetical protein M1839_006061 [Geoglossum umbratile]